MALMTCPDAGQHHAAWSPRARGASGWESGCCGHSGQVAGRPAAASSSTSQSCNWSARPASRSGGGRLTCTWIPRDSTSWEPAPSGGLIQADTPSGPGSSCASSTTRGTIAPLLRISRRMGSRLARSSARSAPVSALGSLARRHERRAASAASGPTSRSIAAISCSSSSKNPPPCEPGSMARVYAAGSRRFRLGAAGHGERTSREA